VESIEQPDKDQPTLYRLEWGIILFLVIILGGMAIFLIGAPSRRFTVCDEAIKDTLKAPSTYRRIDGPNTHEIGMLDGTDHFMIAFDAQNSFGVPIRHRASCDVTDGKASVFVFQEGIFN
jgi:hypothetical protein